MSLEGAEIPALANCSQLMGSSTRCPGGDQMLEAWIFSTVWQMMLWLLTSC